MGKSVTFFFRGNNIVLKVTNQHALRHIIYKKE